MGSVPDIAGGTMHAPFYRIEGTEGAPARFFAKLGPRDLRCGRSSGVDGPGDQRACGREMPKERERLRGGRSAPPPEGSQRSAAGWFTGMSPSPVMPLLL